MERPEKRILILSDLIGQVEDYRKALEKQNYRLYFAASDREAISMLSDQKFDILVTDITLPGMDLAELCKTVRSGTPDIVPVIMLCSEFEKHLLDEAYRCGVDDFILIPAPGVELAGRIHLQLIRLEEVRKAIGDDVRTGNIHSELEVLRRRNQKLVATGKKLLEVGQVRNKLLRIICHEFRTPVSAMMGFIEILMEERGMPDEGHILETINAAAHKMQSLTDLALTVSQIDHESMPGAMQPADLGPIIEYAVSDTLEIHKEGHSDYGTGTEGDPGDHHQSGFDQGSDPDLPDQCRSLQPGGREHPP